MRQSASMILMVRPASFQFNTETAQSNEFQHQVEGISNAQVLNIAQREFDTMVAELTAHKVEVKVIEDTPIPVKPDAIFPNNWIRMDAQGRMTIFPMKNHNRQLEKRKEIIEDIEKNFIVNDILDLSHYELEDRALEGTGSIVFDHNSKIAYACISPRTDIKILNDYCEKIGYTPQVFHAYDANQKLIYHTNVVMCVGSGYVVIGMDTVINQEEKEKLLAQFSISNLEVISLLNEQLLQNFAGNMLQVKNQEGDSILVMSKRAFNSLLPNQIEQIEKYSSILPVSIDLIETIGGGSARCMMAEIFLEKKK